MQHKIENPWEFMRQCKYCEINYEYAAHDKSPACFYNYNGGNYVPECGVWRGEKCVTMKE